MTVLDPVVLVHDAMTVVILGALFLVAIGALLWWGDRGRSW